jgi:peptidoglycan/LPS O-acetylase OafA/YrhL
VGKEVLFQLLLVATVFLGGWISYRFVERPMILGLKARWGSAKLYFSPVSPSIL